MAVWPTGFTGQQSSRILTWLIGRVKEDIFKLAFSALVYSSMVRACRKNSQTFRLIIDTFFGYTFYEYAMDALEALHLRVSAPRLGGEVPSRVILDNMFKAALRAPDHAQLRPWRFLLVAGTDRDRLGDVFVQAQLQDDPELSDAAIAKARGKPRRAPLIIVVIASTREHPKVPEIEQLLSAGAAAQNMLIAAHAQGIGAMWRTGGMAYHATVLHALGLQSNEKLMGFLYVGSIDGKSRVARHLETAEYFKSWPDIN